MRAMQLPDVCTQPQQSLVDRTEAQVKSHQPSSGLTDLQETPGPSEELETESSGSQDHCQHAKPSVRGKVSESP